jgi:putative ABC transport system permease protein
MGRLPIAVEATAQDAHYAARSLHRSPGFGAVAVLTLAIGIGASVAMFSVLDGVMLQTLPVHNQGDLLVLWLGAPTGGIQHWPVDYADLVAYRDASHAFQSIAGVNFQGAAEVVMLDAGAPVTLKASWVTGNFFSVLGVNPALGRALRPSDDVPGAAPVTVISYGFWQRQFGGNPYVLGQGLDWNAKRYTVVGVLPRGFDYPAQADAWFAVLPWFPSTQSRDSTAPAIQFDLVGRIRPGVDLEAAQQDCQAFLRSTDETRPADERGARPVVEPLSTVVLGSVRAILWTSAAAVALLLFIACINVTNLLLIRGSARARELAVRAALGASLKRLARQMLIESGVLALVGGIVGVVLATAAVRALVTFAPPELPRRDNIQIDTLVLVFAFGITVAAALLAGLLPAVLGGRGDLSASLRAGPSALGVSRLMSRLRHGLVVGQVALALLVAVGAGLLTRSLAALEGVDLGFDARRLLILETAIPPRLIGNDTAQAALQRAMLARVAALPDIMSATTMPKPPFSGMMGWFGPYTAEGQTSADQKINPLVNFEVVSADYFRTLAIPVLKGRPFSDRDRSGAPHVAIISRTLARRSWPGQDPIGKRVKSGGDWLTVVGVVGETRYHELTKLEPSIYVPAGQFDGPPVMTLAVRTRVDPVRVIPEIRQALREVNPALTVAAGGSMNQLLAAPLARPRFGTWLVVVFATLTVCLAVVGIYTTLAAMVGQRTREIGIRLALGARESEVGGLVVRQGMLLAGIGCVVGLCGAMLGTRALRSMLFGISPADPMTFAAVMMLLLAAAACACYLPARRATRVDPLVALRAE